ncbi:hypothetical protein VCR4J5_190102 [Vibrio crassostreae]|uniref:Uncharacterized protein n=1 Tax=Vibrio crassostreae TaxID=246167 RepID=A0A822N1L7_9VIBR|nr:hypothetical protein VCR20J5_1080041 [Vibrio crassostreae]CDU07594.1 hypothetical protein VCR14J2_430087 [Vibrio coralliirubri]CDT26556.1 hypothetical protein VCR19J5_170434 [Vibrio crassostreae]CDT31395.1 hypothetical protein VCR4J5_190102 [Vibrio crassostreae]CDT42476.1 hypothetical protein VCR15J5_610067 [Vibrio crassostreae]
MTVAPRLTKWFAIVPPSREPADVTNMIELFIFIPVPKQIVHVEQGWVKFHTMGVNWFKLSCTH